MTSKIQGSFSSFSPQREWLQVALLCATSQHPGKIWWWYGDGDNYPLKIRHDVDNVDDDDDEEEAGGYGVITLNHGIVWMSSRLRILWSISLQNLVVVIINNHHCLQFFRRGELKKVLVIFVTLVEFLFTIYCFSQSRLDDSFFDNHHGQPHNSHRMVFVMGSEMSSILTIIINHYHYCQAHLRMVFVAGSEMGTSGGNSKVSLQFITWEGISNQIRWVWRRM